MVVVVVDLMSFLGLLFPIIMLKYVVGAPPTCVVKGVVMNPEVCYREREGERERERESNRLYIYGQICVRSACVFLAGMNYM